MLLFLAAYAMPLTVICYCYFYIMSSVKRHDKDILSHQRVQGEVQVPTLYTSLARDSPLISVLVSNFVALQTHYVHLIIKNTIITKTAFM